jgi:mRNA interferase RelE/StbE
VTGYRVRYHDGFVHDVDPLPRNLQKRIGKVIQERILPAPTDYGEPLRKELGGLFKVRTGDYRIVYEVDAMARQITIWGVAHRKHVYPAIRRRYLARAK